VSYIPLKIKLNNKIIKRLKILKTLKKKKKKTFLKKKKKLAVALWPV